MSIDQRPIVVLRVDGKKKGRARPGLVKDLLTFQAKYEERAP
jgi:hypothetical protein